mmetsp:Transcript_2323/g.9674  ORF Transcript_2323/g.9674 Transcript_2323/m.9674 type:complete len:202 (-) Transcript_2323:518-1123(-)
MLALPLASARSRSAFCAASLFAGSPRHAANTEACNARPYENESVHGFSFLFMALRCAVASASLCPPERNRMPGTAGGTTRRRHSTVFCATTSTEACSFASFPLVTMFGFKMIPSSITPCSCNLENTHCNTRSVTRCDTFTSWSPSVKISGSTIGTRPVFWQIAAYRARASAFSARHRLDGPVPSGPIVRTPRHLANLAPFS